MKKGFTLIEVLIVVSIISVLVLVFLVSSDGYVTRADLQKQKTNSMVLESAIRQHKLEEGTLPFGSKITKELSVETKKIIEQQLKTKGVTFDSVKDTFYELDKKKIKFYIKGQMKDFDRYFSSDSKFLEGMVFTYDTLQTKKEGIYSGSYVLLEVDGGNEVKPPEPPTVCSTDPSADPTIRLPLVGDGKGITTPFLVSTIGEFQAIKLSPNSFYKLKNDIEGCVTKEWNNGKGFEPLDYFTGNLLPNNFYINNLYINRPTEDNIGIVKQLKISPGSFFGVKLNKPSVIGNNDVGIVTGTLSQGKLDGVRIENGYVEGKQNVGGIIGSNDTLASIFQSNFNGEVIGDINVGGLAGKTTRLDITDSFVRAKVIGNDFIGGLVGNRSDQFQSINKVYIDVTLQGKTNVRVLNGTSTGKDFITNVFYSKDKAAGITIDAGTGKTDTEMKNQTTFTDFDFTTKWNINGTTNDGFPYLK
ncbi:type II secretion system protein [Bacillus paranthracis]|uniref:type II secretion system protein n=1 Tax=Bacillus paranthracis TaxID=2026186 RepID=UPI003D64F931